MAGDFNNMTNLETQEWKEDRLGRLIEIPENTKPTHEYTALQAFMAKNDLSTLYTQRNIQTKKVTPTGKEERWTM